MRFNLSMNRSRNAQPKSIEIASIECRSNRTKSIMSCQTTAFFEAKDAKLKFNIVMNDKDVLGWLDYYLGFTDGISHTFSTVVFDYTSEISPYNTTSLCNAMQDTVVPIGDNWDGTGLHYHVAGFAVMQIMGYQLSMGASESAVTVGHDGTGCDDLGVKPDKPGFRITAEFRRFVDDWNTTDACYDPLGTLLSAPKLHE